RWAEGGLGDFTGRVRFRRRFGIPRQIDAHERVWLTLAGADSRAEVWLNGLLLGQHEGAGEPFEFEVTTLLQDRNELTVEVEAPTGNGGLYGEVALEVRCSAYLRSTRIWFTTVGEMAYLHVTGEVVGFSPTPLELYVILGRTNVAYAQVSAAPEGRTFQIDSEDIRTSTRSFDQPEVVRVDLVSGSSIWYTVEQLGRTNP